MRINGQIVGQIMNALEQRGADLSDFGLHTAEEIAGELSSEATNVFETVNGLAQAALLANMGMENSHPVGFMPPDKRAVIVEILKRIEEMTKIND